MPWPTEPKPGYVHAKEKDMKQIRAKAKAMLKSKRSRRTKAASDPTQIPVIPEAYWWATRSPNFEE